MKENISKESFEATITSLLTASPKNSSKGNAMKNWFKENFDTNARVARITEDKQLGNRIKEQFIYRDPIVVFVVEPEVNISSFISKVVSLQYPMLNTVLVVLADNHAGDYKYKHLLTTKDSMFSVWAEKNLSIAPEKIVGSATGSAITSIEGFSDILAAIRAKPFILLAGMSGTGKTRIVRQLARGCCPTGSDLAKDPNRPENYECISVRPNWHDSTGLMGYITRITDDGKPKYVTTEFVRFLAKAWLYEEKGIPFFLCLDEMNLAPVEQYFAEYLSVVESRRVEDGKIVTDPLVRIADEKLLKGLLNEVYPNQAGEVANLVKMFVELGGIPIPSNFVVMGTVNMDETTCSFPRKVLDRAMTFELNEFDVDSGLESNPDIALGSIDKGLAKCNFTHGWQVYAANKDVCDKLKPYLIAIDKALKGGHGTPFRFAYRTRDEFMAYCVERIKDGTPLSAAADEATSMKILSRIEGDEQTVKKDWLQNLKSVAVDELKKLMVDGELNPIVTESKLNEMLGRLDYGSTSFWF